MRKAYTKEFKINACNMVLKDGLNHKEVADKLQISFKMLYRWIDQYETFGDEAFVGKGHAYKDESELKNLRNKYEQLKIENRILKKQLLALQNT